METKYFTPSIEELHIGYECEINNSLGYKSIFEKKIISYKNENGVYKNELSDIIIMMDDGYGAVRVPYLTTGQIEAEGWESVAINRNGGTIVFVKRITKSLWYELRYNQSNKINPSTKIEISKVEYEHSMYGSYIEHEVIFNGECKCINTFRYITKLLGI